MEKTLYIAVGKEPKENESTLLWAIQNFIGTKICILHVHQPADLALLVADHILEEDGVETYREMERKIMQKKLDDYLHICVDLGVRAKKIHIVMDSVEEGILALIVRLKIKKLVMGADESGNTSNPKSRKAQHWKLQAPPFCTIYFVCNKHLTVKSMQHEQPTSSYVRQTPDHIEYICKVRTLEKLYAEELRTKKRIGDKLEEVKVDRERIIKEAQDVKTILEHKIAIQEQQMTEMQKKSVNDSGLFRFQQEEGDDLQDKFNDCTNISKDLSKISLEVYSSKTQSYNFYTLNSSNIMEATGRRMDPSVLLLKTEHATTSNGILFHTPVTMRLLPTDELFKQEVEILSKYRHPNLGNMVGACQDACVVVYEHLPNGSLEEHLKSTNKAPPLSWQRRIKIALDLCSILIFLHSGRPCSVIHCALRPSCILLDSLFTCKVIGFEFSHVISHERHSSLSTTTKYATSIYTTSYTDPQFFETKEVSSKIDVYSFGIILLELLTGLPTNDIVDDVQLCLDMDDLASLMDSSAGKWPFLQAQQLAHLGVRCCDPKPSKRPDLKLEVWRVIEPMVATCGSALTSMPSEPPS